MNHKPLFPLGSTLLPAAMLLLCAMAPQRAAAQLWPIFDHTADSTIVLYPLYVHEGNFAMMFPFYYRTNEGKDRHYVWPLVKTSEGRLTRVAPFYYSADKDTFTVFPFLRQTPEYTFWTVPPVYTRHDGKFTAVYPFYAQSPEMLFIAPDFYRSGDTWKLWPFYSSTANDKYTEQNMIPLFYNYQSAEERYLWVLPSYYHRKGTEKEWMLFPLYDQNWSPDAARYHVPLLYDYSRNSGGYDFWLLPFRHVKHAEYSKIAIEPVFSVEHSTDPKNPEDNFYLFPYVRSSSPTETSNIVIPLYFGSHAKTADFESNSKTLLPVFRKSWTKSKDNESNDLWFLLYVGGKDATSSYNGLLPFYYRDSAKEGENTHSTFNLLWPIFHREETKSPSGEVLDYNRRFLLFSEAKERSGARVFKLFGLPIVERTK